jgi:hypothetical protein
MRVFLKGFRLSPADWALLGAAYWWLLKARWRMRRLRGREWLVSRSLPGKKQAEPDSARSDEWVMRRARLVNIAARHPFVWAMCLQRSLALREWLSHSGVPTTLRIGVRREGQGIQAHAWVEFKGRVLNDTERVNEIFTPFAVDNAEGLQRLLNPDWEWTR